MGNSSAKQRTQLMADSDIHHMTGEEARRCRLFLNMSQADFALALRMTKYGGQSVSDWETGIASVPGPASLAIEYLTYLHSIGEPLPPAYITARGPQIPKAENG